jgi:hypothetical protein
MTTLQITPVQSTTGRPKLIVVADEDMLLHAVARRLNNLAPCYKYGIDEEADNLALIEDDIRLAHSILALDLPMMLIADENVLLEDVGCIRYYLDRFGGTLNYVSVFIEPVDRRNLN